jgi:ABC-type nitrate/sulfonate/bicarbonate transport system permease component
MTTERISTVTTIVFIIISWQLVHDWTDSFYGIIPAPIAVLREFFSEWFWKEMPSALLGTLTRWSVALISGSGLGMVLGLLIAIWLPALRGPYNLLNGLRTVPITVFIPFSLAIFGIRNYLLPLLIISVSLLVLSNVTQAVSNSSLRRESLLTAFGFSKVAYFKNVLFFEILEVVLSTLRVAVPLCFALETAMDYFMRTNNGLGSLVAVYNESYLASRMFAVIIVIASCGIFSVAILDAISKRSLAWKVDM